MHFSQSKTRVCLIDTDFGGPLQVQMSLQPLQVNVSQAAVGNRFTALQS